MRNVEIKAKIQDLFKLIEIAKSLKPATSDIIKQHDSFYNVPNGRLKLRKFKVSPLYINKKSKFHISCSNDSNNKDTNNVLNNSGELIFYDRPDTAGPKISSFEKSSMCNGCVNDIHKVLEKALGVRKEVKKVRHLFVVGQTRVHIDEVEDLGNFMELEVVLRDDQSLEEGEKIANELMAKLGISKEDLISGAYADMLK